MAAPATAHLNQEQKQLPGSDRSSVLSSSGQELGAGVALGTRSAEVEPVRWLQVGRVAASHQVPLDTNSSQRPHRWHHLVCDDTATRPQEFRVICVQFIFKPGTYDDDFHRLDNEIDAYARSLPGYHHVETWHSRDGDIVNAMYYFAERKALTQLARLPQHLEAKSQVHRWYDGYRIVVTEVTATYGDGRLPE